MAEKPAQDKTEKPTEGRRQKARNEGNVARSVDLNSVAIFFMAIVVLRFALPGFIQRMGYLFYRTYYYADTFKLTPSTIPYYFNSLVSFILPFILIFLGAVVVAGVGVSLAQVGWIFSPGILSPKFERLNFIQGFQRLFSPNSLVELAKSLFKGALLLWVSYLVIRRHISDFMHISYMSLPQILGFLGSFLWELSIKAGLLLIVLAVADFAYQRYRYEKNLMMTKEEVKDEMMQHEGNPQVKSKIRSMQMQLTRNRMLAAVKDATVVVTNPTHVAVALQYRPSSKVDAPKVVAKGRLKLAEKIKEIAREHGIPIIENKPLAWSLYQSTEIGFEIPIELYQAVAELLAEVYKRYPNSFKKVLTANA